MFSLNAQIAYENRYVQAAINRNLRDVTNVFHKSLHEFQKHFRLPQTLAITLIEELEPIYDAEYGSLGIPFYIKCLTALNVYATGSYQYSLKNLLHVSQPTASRAINTITNMLNTHLMKKYILFPTTDDERTRITNSFQREGLPNIIGLIDCTQFALSALKKHVESAYICRKQFHSINTQIICDHELKIRNINARYPGSTHDSFIWGNSKVLAMFQNENEVNRGNQTSWLLGDSGYPLQPWLMVPISNPTSESQKQFNVLHRKIRNKVERVNGIWKNRFRCILGERKLHYEPMKAAKIINATAVLHNFLIYNKFTDEYSITDVIPSVPIVQGVNIHPPYRGNDSYLNAGRTVRNTIISNLIIR